MSQVNLLPPELRARQQTRRLTTLIVGIGAAIVVLLIGFWFLQSQKLSGVNDDIAAQNQTNAGLQSQISRSSSSCRRRPPRSNRCSRRPSPVRSRSHRC